MLYNTCCVRENAENKALGNVIWLKELKKDKPELLICVGGCMTQEPGMAAAHSGAISLRRSWYSALTTCTACRNTSTNA